jgi:ABC-type phosphate transport system substrate-binding protein
VVEESAGRLRSISIDGVAPSADNVEYKRYGMIRETLFVTWSPPSPAVARFIRFVRSAEGGKLIRVNGAVPAK